MIILVLLVQHATGNSYSGYVIAPQTPTTHPPEKVEHGFVALPTLIELPQLGEGAQSEKVLQVKPRQTETCAPCPPSPAPAPPTVGNAEGKVNQPREQDLLDEEEKVRARFARRHKRELTAIVELDNKCNSKHLRSIMQQSITSNLIVSKVTIAERASSEIGGHFDVVCTTGVFSYYVAAQQFCEVTFDGCTCFAYRRDDMHKEGLQLSNTDRSLQKKPAELTEVEQIVNIKARKR